MLYKVPSIFDLHVHTSKGSPDSGLSAEEMVEEGLRIGLTGAMATEHNGWEKNDFIQFSAQSKLHLVNALEVYTPMGHVIALGIEQHVSGFSGGVEAVRELRRIVDNVGGFLIIAHPFRFLFDPPGMYTQNKLFEDPNDLPITPEKAAEHPIFELVHEIEVVNGGNLESENRFTQEVVKVLGRSGTGGSDCHSTAGMGKGSTLFRGDVRTHDELLEALHSGEFVPLGEFHVGKPSLYGEASWLDREALARDGLDLADIRPWNGKWVTE